MDQPSQIIRRIRRRQARSSCSRQPCAPRVPAPSPAQPPAREPVKPSPAPEETPRGARGHALYSQLMRNHDRMGTRHLKG